MIRTLLFAVAALAAVPVSAQIYKWVDSNGKVHFSDKAPPDATKTETLKIQSYTAPPVIESAADKSRGKQAKPPAAGNAQLVMYATSWCGYCRKARAYLAQKGISYREIDIEASAANREEFKAYGGRGVPFFVAGSRNMRGFSPDAMDRFLASSR